MCCSVMCLSPWWPKATGTQSKPGEIQGTLVSNSGEGRSTGDVHALAQRKCYMHRLMSNLETMSNGFIWTPHWKTETWEQGMQCCGQVYQPSMSTWLFCFLGFFYKEPSTSFLCTGTGTRLELQPAINERTDHLINNRVYGIKEPAVIEGSLMGLIENNAVRVVAMWIFCRRIKWSSWSALMWLQEVLMSRVYLLVSVWEGVPFGKCVGGGDSW